MIEKSNTRKSS